MLRRLPKSIAIALTVMPVGYSAYADVPDWVRTYTQEALAAPVTLENAQRYRWYQIGVAVRADHPMVYDLDIRSMQLELQRHGNAVAADLKARLDERFAAIRSVEEAGAYYQQCSWILSRPGGEHMTPVQSDLLTYCEQKAVPALYTRLVGERARNLDIRLTTLRDLDVTYPSRVIGTIAGVARADVPAVYARALADRLKKGKAQVTADLSEHFRIKTVSETTLQTDAAQCRELLGQWYPQGDPIRDMTMSDPLSSVPAGTDVVLGFSGAIGAACRRDAKAWLMQQRPAIDADIRKTFAGLDPERGPILGIGTRCSAVLGRWFSSFDGFELTLTGPLQQTCREDAQRLNARASDLRAQALTAQIAGAPKTLDGLERNGWFSVSDDAIAGVHDPRDPERGEVDQLVRSRTEALLQPVREAAREAALKEIRGLYDPTRLSDADLEPARRICGPYLGRTTRALPPGGGDLKAEIRQTCSEEEGQVVVRRAEAAVAASDIDAVLGKGRLVITTPDGRQAYAEPRAVVMAAAGNGLQIKFRRTRTWLFWTKESLHVTPFGRDNPMLNGDLEPEIDPAGERLWRVKDLQILPGLDGPFTTLACLTMGPEAAQAVVGLGLAGMASLFVLDLPRTGSNLIWAAGTLTTNMAQCESARRSFFTRPGPRSL